MTRYNSDANEPYVGMEEEHIPPEQLDGYREGVDRVLWWLKECGEYAYDFELRQAIKAGII